jgi:ribosomal protein S18 acetylase RimI-like enzyme
MLIRNGARNDKAGYLEVQQEAFPTINSERDARFFDEKVSREEILVVEADTYAGHLCFGTHEFNPPFINSVFIEELAVREPYRGRGFATALLDRLVRHCKERGIRSIHLGTGVGNDRAASYYERLGFEKVGWLEDIDPDSEYDHGQVIYAIMVARWNPKAKTAIGTHEQHESSTGDVDAINGRYRHYKGGIYAVLGVAHHSETLEELVVYRAEYDSEEFGDRALWVRPKTVFLETVEIEGKEVPRFAFVGDAEP